MVQGIAPPPPRTIWGLEPIEVHDRFWAARGVQVVRQGFTDPLSSDAELFLLTDPHSFSIFRLGQLVEAVSWLKPKVLFVRLHITREQGYHERIITDRHDRFLRFDRVYGSADWRLARVALTPRRDGAEMWQRAQSVRDGWRQLRRTIAPNQRTTLSVEGSVYDNSDEAEVAVFLRDLVSVWKRPDVTIGRARRFGDAAWMDRDLSENGTRFIGPVWVGTGRSLDDVGSVVGPAVLWDEPEHRPAPEAIAWDQIEPADVLTRPIRPKRLNSLQRGSKRAFDILFALAALLLTLPFYPLVMLAIYLEDGRPFFFGHRRESMGGREFPCLKFRTMRKNAEDIKHKLMQENQSDGPQFYIENDPRITRVGNFLRKTNLDELPQFINVLVGHMSIVGPRPSPYKENQYCPPWREARLSVRPGITGLWQVYRSREEGKDFQEWIRFDITYVENLSWRMDLRVIYGTFLLLIGRKPRLAADA